MELNLTNLVRVIKDAEAAGDLALLHMCCARIANEMKTPNMKAENSSMFEAFQNVPAVCGEIFETVLNVPKRTYVFLSVDYFVKGGTKQRYQNLAVALAQAGNSVIYINPFVFFDETDKQISGDDAAAYVISHAEQLEGVSVFTPIMSQDRTINSLPSLLHKISESYPDAVFLVSEVAMYGAVKKFKGKHKIVFDCADDNSDFKYAHWTSEKMYRIESQLVELADDITCTAASLFLRKAVIENRSNVHLSQNAVSVAELKYGADEPEPDDLKDIPHPRIGYVGVIYKRFDRELLYRLAENNPDKSFVIVGRIAGDYVTMKYDNMYFLGQKSHDELGAYYRNMDICIIPYFDNAKMSMACDPVKIHEHICCGVPTITTHMPDTAVDRPLTYHGNTAEEFQKHIDMILKERPTIDNNDRVLYLARHSWIARACHIMRIANNALYEYESREQTLLNLRKNFREVKDLHSNFKMIYAMTLWNDDPEVCKILMEEAYSHRATEFNREILHLFAAR